MKVSPSQHPAALACFSGLTLLFLCATWITFKGFNGGDDVHYAMLSAKVLKHSFNPFEPNDIFAGRVALVYLQAFIYKLGGINAFTTSVGSVIAAVICCYLTIFKFGRFTKWQQVLAGTALFYFNPVLRECTVGVMPDIYVLLTGIGVLLLLQRVRDALSNRRILLDSALTGVLIFGGMFFKENALVFLPFALLILLTGKNKRAVSAALTISATFLLSVLLAGLIYYHFTGDFFFRALQIRNSAYLNPCDYSSMPLSDLVVRLTYGVWMEFIKESFYPVILGGLVVFIGIFFTRSISIQKNQAIKTFVLLFLIALYFPFSLKGYQPLCFVARHFLFLLAPAVVVLVALFETAKSDRPLQHVFIAASSVIWVVCIVTVPTKWYWCMYFLLLVFFILQRLSPMVRNSRRSPILFATILCCYLPAPLFYTTSNWWDDMVVVSRSTAGGCYYFPTHESLVQYKLLYGFRSDLHFYSLEPNPFKIYKLYYDQVDPNTFEPGWLIIKRKYTTLPQSFFTTIDSLETRRFFRNRLSHGDVEALFVDSPGKLSQLRSIVAEKMQNR